MVIVYYYLLYILSCGVFVYYLYHKYKIKAYAPNRRNFKSLLVGHRGSRGFPDIPENSLASFRYCIERGAQAIEIDCRLTKDGHMVVIHDDDVKRLTTSETGNISEMTLNEVKKLSYRDCTNTCERIPTLHEVMSLAKSYNVKVFIEIKCTDIQSTPLTAKKFSDIFAEYDAYDWACIIAFNPLVQYYARLYDPNIECCLLYSYDFIQSIVDTNTGPISYCMVYLLQILDFILVFLCKHILPEFIGCTMIGPHYRLLSLDDVLNFKRRGLAIYIWVTNTIGDADFFIKMHCSAGTDCQFPKPCKTGKRSSQEGVTQDD